MKITIINGTNRVGNKSMNIARAAVLLAQGQGHDVSMITLENFTELFRGDHITLENATESQLVDLRNMRGADALFFVVPTYHSGIPSPLKNFLDTLTCHECYEDKVIAIISSNDSNHDLGARQAREVLNGILSFQKAHSFILPRITILNHDAIDMKRLGEFIEYTSAFSV